MVVYYLNITSQPCRTLNKIVLGDCCVVQYQGLLYLSIVTSDFHKISETGQLSYIAKTPCEEMLHSTDCVLYSFDSISKRSGQSEFLTRLDCYFQENEIHAFFNNLLLILAYKEDKLDLLIFSRLLKSPVSYTNISLTPLSEERLVKKEVDNIELVDTLHNKPIHTRIKTNTDTADLMKKERVAPDRYLFYDRLETDHQELWMKMFNSGKDIRDIFVALKSKDKISFNSILKEYRKEFPEKTIYSLKNEEKDK